MNHEDFQTKINHWQTGLSDNLSRTWLEEMKALRKRHLQTSPNSSPVRGSTKATQAYIIVVPDPYYSPGIVLRDEEVRMRGRYLAYVLGENRRQSNCRYACNGLQKSKSKVSVAIGVANPKLQDGIEKPGSKLQKAVHKDHRRGGIKPNGHSEWRGLYGNKLKCPRLAERLVELLDTFLSAEAQHNLTWDGAKAFLDFVSKNTLGPTKPTQQVSPPKYPRIAISITPNILENRVNKDFEVFGYSKTVIGKNARYERGIENFTYWIKLVAHNTEHGTADDLFNTYQSETPDFGYGHTLLLVQSTTEVVIGNSRCNAHQVSLEDLESVDLEEDTKRNATRNLDHNQPNTRAAEQEIIEKKLKQIEINAQRALIKKLLEYGLSGDVASHSSNNWIEVRGETKCDKHMIAVDFLRSLVSTFHDYKVFSWDASRWPVEEDMQIPNQGTGDTFQEHANEEESAQISSTPKINRDSVMHTEYLSGGNAQASSNKKKSSSGQVVEEFKQDSSTRRQRETQMEISNSPTKANVPSARMKVDTVHVTPSTKIRREFYLNGDALGNRVVMDANYSDEAVTNRGKNTPYTSRERLDLIIKYATMGKTSPDYGGAKYPSGLNAQRQEYNRVTSSDMETNKSPRRSIVKHAISKFGIDERQTIDGKTVKKTSKRPEKNKTKKTEFGEGDSQAE
ncbi:hypothetical protein AG1IA_06776 [Rhizoctonia solani AG-1 IA]|uniref:Uncharacterized protein n=1 Tax=Thanatephorus cucumeris (strain AG1-IA) TaxID=983506 RepID=L8WM06_THACA|nr:hypothetical protein AG1IA_06776 [Rhizoctonia solani AG-1 IA]